MEEPERPDPDANASEIQEWMEKHFEWAIAEGLQDHEDEETDE